MRRPQPARRLRIHHRRNRLRRPQPLHGASGVALTHFDGHGNLRQLDFVTRNGVPASPDWRPATGTYSIDSNCTGSAVISPADGSPSLNLRLVVIDRGRQVLTTVAGNSTNSIGTKVR